MSEGPDSSACPRTLLVIDDQHSVCVSLSFLLESAGYRVVTAQSGRAALGLIQTETINAALIDVHMPGMNGFDTCLAIQSAARDRGLTIPVWFMTGAFTSVLNARCAELGGRGVFRKPFEFAALLSELEAGLAAPVPLPAPPPTRLAS